MTQPQFPINVWGRPKKWSSVKKLEKQIQEYFESCFELEWYERYVRSENGEMKKDEQWNWEKEYYQEYKMKRFPTITGLAVALGTSRQTLLNYEGDEKFFDTIKKAKNFIESFTEEQMLSGKINPAAAIFNLKNNWGWKDKTEVDIENTQITQVNINILWPNDNSNLISAPTQNNS